MSAWYPKGYLKSTSRCNLPEFTALTKLGLKISKIFPTNDSKCFVGKFMLRIGHGFDDHEVEDEDHIFPDEFQLFFLLCF